MSLVNIFFSKFINTLKNNKGTSKLLVILILFVILRTPIDLFIVKYFSKLNIIYFSIIYFFLALLYLPTLPMTLISSSLYTPLKASIYIAFIITFVGIIQIKFPKSLGLGIKDDKYIVYLAKNMRLKTLLDKFFFFVLARYIPLIPLAVTTAFAMKIFHHNSKLNLFIFLLANFIGTLSITFCVLKILSI